MSQTLTTTSKPLFQGLFDYENKIGDVYERCTLFNGAKYDQVVVFPKEICLYRGKRVSRIPRDLF